MSSKNHNEDNDPHSSGYEGDVSDQVSDASTLVNSEAASSSNATVGTSNKSDESETGIITIGCDARDAGPGIQSDVDAQFGTIWIGCSVRDVGANNKQAFVSSDSECEVEHIQGIRALADEEGSDTEKRDSGNKGVKSCEQAQGFHFRPPLPFFLPFAFCFLLFLLLLLLDGVMDPSST
ncbi:uncharacterized protein BDV17DRAFT_295924 [Aspergillus undulatus]|uniref:uncharacterized protein n=1 Tax=Aspergillus undulatus TaxID=1810928 RepID=UPI003CCDB890